MKKFFEFGITHAGVFHADDVFATALLKLINPSFQTKRVNRLEENIPDDVIIYDIGFGQFDHHQADKKLREDDTPYASFGLLWDHYKEEIKEKIGLADKHIKIIDENLVRPIDLQDNGGNHNTLSDAIAEFNPVELNGITPTLEDFDEAFEDAVSFATRVLKNSIAKQRASYEQELYLKKAIAKEEEQTNEGLTLFLEKFVSLQDEDIKRALLESRFCFVLSSNPRGGYTLRQVCGKLKFPQEWCGAEKEKLPEGVSFCHPGNWMLVIDKNTKEEALEVAAKVEQFSMQEQE